MCGIAKMAAQDDVEDLIEEKGESAKELKRRVAETELPPELRKNLARSSDLKGIHESNLHDLALFYAYLDGKIPKHLKQLVIDNRERRNLHDWDDGGFNIVDPEFACPNGCRYCYTLFEDRRLGRTRQATGKYHRWDTHVNKGWRHLPKGTTKTLLLFSSHDITEEMIPDFLTVAGKLLTAGYDILVVSKMRPAVAEAIAPFLLEHKDHVEVRITLGSIVERTTDLWEPGAPSPFERLWCLMYLSQQGINVSVSMEPLLGDDPEVFATYIAPYVSSIWLGLMNHIETFENNPKLRDELPRIRAQQSHLAEIVNRLRSNPKIFWKRSIVMDIKLGRGTTPIGSEALKAEQAEHTSIIADYDSRLFAP